jgi:hypothetical protein
MAGQSDPINEVIGVSLLQNIKQRGGHEPRIPVSPGALAVPVSNIQHSGRYILPCTIVRHVYYYLYSITYMSFIVPR